MPLIATRGAASAQGFGEFAQTAVATYIEDVFSTYLYTGTAATLTITNGIDLSGEGGLVWSKKRGVASDHGLTDSARGISKQLATNSTAAETTQANDITSFNSDGFTIGSGSFFNSSGQTNVTWTFRKAEKFFDVVTYTGTGSARTINHNLGSVPGCIIVKRTNLTGNWGVYHRSLGATKYIYLNGNNTSFTDSGFWNDTEPTSTNFTVGISSVTNNSGDTYVAYLFAHDAGGFGDAGDQNVISCGSFTTDGGGNIPTVNLGYEPQWILAKPSSGAGNWFIMDNMRGWYNQQADQGNALFPNTSGAEAAGYNAMIPTATGFTGPNVNFGAGITYIYIAIRRGPMKTPTTGTSVFYPYVTASVSNVGSTSGTMYNSQIVTDHAWQKAKGGTDGWYLGARLTGTAYMKSETTAAESTSAAIVWDSNRGAWAFSDPNYGLYCFKRAPGFFDVVCYTGTGVARTVSHNLGVAPELIILKKRNTGGNDWVVYSQPTGNQYAMYLNLSYKGDAGSTAWNSTTPTSSVFSLGSDGGVNGGSDTFVAYLFATVAGVSKVGSYTGTGTTLQVNCGFTNGSRFVLIKRTDSTGDWYVWDSARGIVAGNDPYLLLNSTAAEVTNTDYVDTYSAGFEISSTAPAAINANGGSYIFLAIA